MELQTKKDVGLALVAVGSNLGNRQENFHKALKQIMIKCGDIVDQAGVFETKPIGGCTNLFS